MLWMGKPDVKFKKYRSFEFECPRCGHVFDDLIKDTDEKVDCPKCHALTQANTSRIVAHSVYATPPSWSVS